VGRVCENEMKEKGMGRIHLSPPYLHVPVNIRPTVGYNTLRVVSLINSSFLSFSLLLFKHFHSLKYTKYPNSFCFFLCLYKYVCEEQVNVGHQRHDRPIKMGHITSWDCHQFERESLGVGANMVCESWKLVRLCFV